MALTLMFLEYSFGYGFDMGEHSFSDLLIKGYRGLFIGALVSAFDYFKTNWELRNYQTQIDEFEKEKMLSI